MVRKDNFKSLSYVSPFLYHCISFERISNLNSKERFLPSKYRHTTTQTRQTNRKQTGWQKLEEHTERIIQRLPVCSRWELGFWGGKEGGGEEGQTGQLEVTLSPPPFSHPFKGPPSLLHPPPSSLPSGPVNINCFLDCKLCWLDYWTSRKICW